MKTQLPTVYTSLRRQSWRLFIIGLVWGLNFNTWAGTGMALDAVVESVRQTTVAAQVSGAVVSLSVRPGDSVRAGQELLRLDARAAQQGAQASAAQVRAARANLEVANKELARQRQLFQQNYISQAALDRTLAQQQAAQAQVQALQLQTEVARTQSGFFVVAAPYSGVVGEVPVQLGDMTMPGKPLLQLHDPTQLRVTVAVPQSAWALARPTGQIRIELAGLQGGTQMLVPTQAQWLPTADPSTHTVELRLGLPAQAHTAGARPGQFTRVWLPGASDEGRIFVPTSAVVRRAELSAVYVESAQKGQRPLLRQVRLGPVQGDRVEVLSGLSAQDRVVTQPDMTAR